MENILKGIVVSMRNWIDSAQNRDYWRPLVSKVAGVYVVGFAVGSVAG